MYRTLRLAAIALIATLSLSGCQASQTTDEVVLVTHDSFAMDASLIQQFESSSGFRLKIVKAGEAVTMVNKLVLTKEQPIGDAVFGIDNNLSELATSNGLISGKLTAVDFGDVCMNYDLHWFAERKIAVPESIRQLTAAKYRNLTVVSNPGTSSSGLAFLATTIDVFGEDGFLAYWSKLKSNGLKVVAGWEDAYFTEFSGSSGKGDYPIALSYSSSPAFEIRDDGKSQTASILYDCFRQTEFVGELNGAKNSAGAKALIKFMKAKEFQTALPEAMYVYPIDPNIPLPADWQKFAPSALTLVGDELDVAGNRTRWLKSWSNLFE